MKSSLITLPLLLFSGASLAQDAALNACLHQAGPSREIRISKIDTSAIYQEEAPDASSITIYSEFKGRKLGYRESGKGQILIYGDQEFPLAQALHIGQQKPSTREIPAIDYYLSDWLEITTPESTYICLNYPFPGIGQSGEFQYIRNALIFEIGKKTGKTYYTAGDIRQDTQR